MLSISVLRPDCSQSPLSPARLSLLPLGLERATPTRPTPPPTVLSPAQPPPRPAGTPTPVLPTGLQGSVGGEGGKECLGVSAKLLSEHSEFGGLSPKLPESWYQVWRFPSASSLWLSFWRPVVSLRDWLPRPRLCGLTLSFSRLWDSTPLR